jgi:GT2 family glycosyltransferase
MKDNNPLIEIVIPNWNGYHLLVQCLESLRRQTCRDFSITVVDNGSKDKSVEKLARDYAEVKVIPFEQNRGFSVAVNAGIKDASSQWILLLNNDIEVDSNCLHVLKETINQNLPYDYYALRMMNFHDRELLDGAGDGFLRGGAGYRLGTREKYGPPYNIDKEVFGACAGAALYKREFFDTVGLFDEDFFAYLEDVDINLRAKALGCHCCYLSSAVVYHIGSATFGSKINAVTVRLSTRNTLCLLVKNYPCSFIFRYFLIICSYQLFWFVYVIKKRNFLPYLQGLAQAACIIPKMIEKRRKPKLAQALPKSEFAKLLLAAETEVIISIMAQRKMAGKGNALFSIYCKIFL